MPADYVAEIHDESHENLMVRIEDDDRRAFMWALAEAIYPYVSRDITVTISHPNA